MAEAGHGDGGDSPWEAEPDPLAVFRPPPPDAVPAGSCLRGAAAGRGLRVRFAPSVGKTKGELEEERLARPKGKVYRAIATYRNDDPDDLDFRANDLVLVIDEGDGVDDWWEGVLGGQQGCFPGTYMKQMAYQPEDQSPFWEQPAPEAPPPAAPSTAAPSPGGPSAAGVFKFSMGTADDEAEAEAPEPAPAPSPKKMFTLEGFGGDDSTADDDADMDGSAADDATPTPTLPEAGEAPGQAAEATVPVVAGPSTPEKEALLSEPDADSPESRRYSGTFGFAGEYDGRNRTFSPTGSVQNSIAEQEEEEDSPSEDEEAMLELESLTESSTMANPRPRRTVSPVFGRSSSVSSSVGVGTVRARSSTSPDTKQERFFCSALDVSAKRDHHAAIAEGQATLPRVYREGWLRKKGGGKLNHGRHAGNRLARRNWKTRWFVLDGTTLRYFKSTGDLTRQLGHIRLDSDTVVSPDASRQDPNGILLSTFVRNYHLVAPTAADKDAWFSSLTEAKERAALALET